MDNGTKHKLAQPYIFVTPAKRTRPAREGLIFNSRAFNMMLTLHAKEKRVYEAVEFNYTIAFNDCVKDQCSDRDRLNSVPES